MRRKAKPSGGASTRVSSGFGRSLTRAADSTLGVKLTYLSCNSFEQDLQHLLDSTSDAMLLVLDGPEGKTGAMLLDRRFVAQVVEYMTMGSFGKVIERPLTRTDAALLQPFVDRCLTGVEACLDIGKGFRFGAFVADAHSLGNLLEATRFAVHKAQMQLGSSDQPIEITYAFPVSMPLCVADRDDSGTVAIGTQLRNRLMDTQVTARVALCKVLMPFEQVKALQSGQVIGIPSGALAQASLTCGGEQVAEGKLGQFNGFRALKIAGRLAPKLHAPPEHDERVDLALAPKQELVEAG